MHIRHMAPGDDKLSVSRIYEESWRAAYRGILPQDYLDRIPAGYATDADGTPWELWAERNRAMCPTHGHILRDEKAVAATHDPLF